ncbi:5-oxoprolinase subunit PxpB [Fulvivirga sp. RKSG066]|uniref:5-oxoprolinase subunit PxpB n=1 Tax=Fulvivirga aurantia TaxID=2529383 RepID=UPI0012BD0010|nr:5-oxoprolinase subunit PxpB [Fulvivirga aurantia]MTI20361.1 5-oxoprolinase subunit PxpB [Fulvivirga aurantia]
MMDCIPYGDRAMLVRFKQEIDPAINQQVRALKEQLIDVHGVLSMIPAYCSLTIVFDPNKISYLELESKSKNCKSSISAEKNGRVLKIPVCYDPDIAPDLEEVKTITGLTTQEIVKLHTSHTYQVYMMGFIPGFAYMGKLPAELKCPRRDEPRRAVPKGAVGIAGLQTGIYPSVAPGGWQLIGGTPIECFKAKDDHPFLFETGDTTKFYSIDRVEFSKIEVKVKNNEFNYDSLYE